MANKIVPKPGESRAPAFDVEANLDKLSDSQKYFYKKFNRVNRERWEVNQIYRRSGRRVGLGLGCFALGIYFYTMYAVKQEKFLDEDFNTLPDNVKET